MRMDVYNRDILRWTTRIPHLGRLDHPQVSAARTSRICGSRLTAEAVLDAGKITDFAQEVKACALGQASAAIVGQNVIGLDAVTLADVHHRFSDMLKGAAPDFPEPWAGLAVLAPVRDYPGRHGSVMLPFEVLTDLFEAAG